MLQQPCDRAIARAMPETIDAPPRHASWILATTILASSVAFIDGSVVNVGLPAIGRSLNEGGSALAWVVNGYLLPLSALLLFGGAAGDLYGRRRLLVVSSVLFATASLVCALAPSFPWLLAGRALQGIAAAFLMPNSLAILGSNFSGASRGRAIGIWAAFGAAVGAVAPIFGGWLIDAIGWRAIFFVNLPIAVATIVLALRYVPNERDHAHVPLDIAGGALATLALGAATWGLTAWSAARQPDASAIVALTASVVAFVAFLLVERRRGGRAMLPLVLFEVPEFVGLTLLTLLLYGALGGMLVLIPYALIEARGYSATAAGAALIPLPLVIAFGSSTMGRLAGKLGSRLPLMVGSIVTAIGFALALRISMSGNYWTTVFPALLCVSIGMTATAAPLTNAVLASVDRERSGVASGFNSAIARTGGLLATALLGGVLAAQGNALVAPFKVAALVATGAAIAASICAFVWIGRGDSVR